MQAGLHAKWGDIKGVDGNIYVLYKCGNCGMIAVYPSPDDLFLTEFYSKNYRGRVKSGIVENADSKANRAAIEDGGVKIEYIEKFSNKHTGDILDVGCGHGFFLYAAKLKGYEAHGIDIDEDAIRYGTEIMGLDIKRNPVDSFNKLPADHYDIVTFWQVLEHLAKPGTCIREVGKLLKAGGIVAGSVPNIGGIGYKLQRKKWYLLVPPEHISYFDEKSFGTMLISAGYTPLFVGTIPLYASPYFSFGIRPRLLRYAENVNSGIYKFLLKSIHRTLTLIKRYVIYLPLNKLVLWFGMQGNSLFFVARKR
jgi:2-polyprenyl-3-methyl-5-hydroxy-6-metoxy-1,4-benzoquinol methylase